MSQNTQWDSLDYQVLNFPYNRIEAEFSPEQRLSSGQNIAVTRGGKIIKRPGTIQLDAYSELDGRVDRLWTYETIESPPNVYIVASVFTGTYWELRYKHMSTPATAWQTPTSYRDCNASTLPHTLATSRGLAYIKGFPTSVSSEKLGTVILDGTGGTIAVRPWGILGPQTPAFVNGAVTRITVAMSDVTTSMTIGTDSGFPAVPFIVTVGFEQMLVTAGVPGVVWTVTRGYNGTTAVEHSQSESVTYLSFLGSTHAVTVNFGWIYTYAYKSITGQISNRAPLQTNPDLKSSNTGPFLNLVPSIQVMGHSDTANIPTICIYRTTDGGGTFYKLEEINNPGALTTQYLDDSLESGTGGGVFNDPVPDAVLDQFNVGPSLVSNSPPPAVLAPEVTGVDTPSAATPIVSFQSRLWYAIGNVLFFSAEEELNEGIPEESWPSGSINGRNGNFYRFQYPIINLAETSDALYVFTIQSTYRITGHNLESFSPGPAFENLGAPVGHPRAVTRFGETLAFITHDFRVCLVKELQITQISDPLYTDLVNVLDTDQEFDLKYFGDLDMEYLVISSHQKDDTEDSRQWVYDLKKSQLETKEFWFPPWTIRSTASLSGRVLETSSQRRLVFYIYDPDTDEGDLVYLDPTNQTPTDSFLGDDVGFTYFLETHQMLVPAGNHVNTLRVPGTTPVVYAIDIDRILYPNDFDPDVYWYYDDIWTAPFQAIRTENPARRNLSKGYKSLHYTIHQACQHFSVRISKTNCTDLFTLLRLTIVWNPDAGA